MPAGTFLKRVMGWFMTMSMIDKTCTILEKYIDLLTEYQVIVTECLRRGNQQDDPEAFMLQSGFDFGIRTIRAMLLLLKQSEDNAIFANILCRTFYEVSLRLLWAARTPDGWRRLPVLWATQTRKWTKRAQEHIPRIPIDAESTLQSMDKVLNHTDANGNKYKHPPRRIEDMIKEIEDCDKKDGLREKNENAAAFEYTYVYSLLCQSTHGHIEDISNRELIAFLPVTCNSTMVATVALLRTHCHLAFPDPKPETEAIIRRIVDIMKDVHE